MVRTIVSLQRTLTKYRKRVFLAVYEPIEGRVKMGECSAQPVDFANSHAVTKLPVAMGEVCGVRDYHRRINSQYRTRGLRISAAWAGDRFDREPYSFVMLLRSLLCVLKAILSGRADL
ncbi:MAG: hypothetical protein D4R77_08885 [Planctomycetaceae bacterium]|nr:MAG: hypothetical protein D4R77_08885 [Planctomycetaceae bacterium]